MARRKNSIFMELLELLCQVPWWISPIVATIIYVSLYYAYPAYVADSSMGSAFVQLSKTIAPVLAIIFLAPAPISFFNSKRKARQLDLQTGIASIRNLDWMQFEELLGEIFRRKGFRVLENHQAGPDGGVDLRLRKDGQNVLVQCKQWRSQKVGVSVIRELYGVMASEGAPTGIVVTSGQFTQDAKAFATKNRVMLIDGEKLEPLVKEAQTEPIAQANSPVSAEKFCPSCGKEMILRIAKKGSNAGNQFWGCSGFPRCRETLAA